ncbi:MAG: phosphatidylserine decarboxylase [Gammaproteobacteria bacterium]|nr:phosphatidylserine decarboxylase [Gammaproteobacteria bacterium]
MLLWDYVRTLPQYMGPQHGLSRVVGRLARSERPWLAGRLKTAFLRRYAVDLSEALEPDPEHYLSFNRFFTRALKPDARPLPADQKSLVSPADGVIAEFGTLQRDRMLQAKGRTYSVDELLANNIHASQQYHDGEFATVYLAPHNYHRVHAPCGGQIHEVVYVPGVLFAVNPHTVRVVPRVLARNERVILHCTGDYGPFTLILVGAVMVGSMELVSCDVAALAASRRISHYAFECPFPFARGAELGRFNMGSTVIALFGRNVLQWTSTLARGCSVRMGQALANPSERG